MSIIIELWYGNIDPQNRYGRSVRLDVYATDSTGKRYDIEIQRADEGVGEKRARYNQSIMDTNHLPAGAAPQVLAGSVHHLLHRT